VRILISIVCSNIRENSDFTSQRCPKARSLTQGELFITTFRFIKIESPRMQSRNSKIGLVLFTIYLIVYGGFVFLNAFAPDTMEATPIAGLNVAILYGFGLIIGALVLSGLYGFLCREKSSSNAKEPRA
jgi:uncharacterized membrane protein (DUF485 family)